MELYHLRSFATVAEEAHLTRAAERLYTSQPAVSAQIKALEDELGVSLFERTPRGMLLTEAGRMLLEPAQAALAAAHDLKARARALQGQVVGRVRIGLNSDAAFLKIVELQAVLRREHPHLAVEFVGGNTGTNLPDLRSARLDAAFISGDCPDPALAAPALREEALVVAVPAALSARAECDVAGLAALPWIHTAPDCAYYVAMRALFQAHGCEPREVVMTGHEDAVEAMLRAGVGLAIMRREKAEAVQAEGLARILPLALPGVPLRFAYQARRAAEPVLKAVLAAMAEVWEQGEDALQDVLRLSV